MLVISSSKVTSYSTKSLEKTKKRKKITETQHVEIQKVC